VGEGASKTPIVGPPVSQPDGVPLPASLLDISSAVHVITST